ncbi:MAG: class I SAM-dependent methyltransferase, partial [Coriobacteriales bacterium]
MSPHRFDAARLGRLNDIARLDDLAPGPMWKAFGVPDARLVVELGAGTGMFAREFAAMMKPGGRLFAVDSSSEMVRWMTQHFVGGTDVEIVPTLADAAELPLD